MGASDRSELARFLQRADRPDAVTETKLLAELEHRLFGHAIEPVRLGRYVLLRRIGTGGFGSVYLGYDPELDRRVALKLLDAPAGGEDVGAQLLHEAQALARFSHPNVIGIYDVGTFDPNDGPTARVVAAHGSGIESTGVFVVMELVEGDTLSRWLRSRPRTWREIVDVFLQAGQGLAAAHRAGLVHRDFKPDNVVVGRDGRTRVLDFGLALSGAGDSGRPLLAGTPAYMAPEQLAGLPSDARADQYAFALALWEALYGATPRSHASPLRPTAPTPAGGRGRAVPEAMRTALVRGLATEPDARWPALDPLLDRLAAIRVRGPRRWLPMALAGGLLLVGWWAGARSDPEDACRTSEDRLVGVWDDDVRGRVAARFAGVEAPWAAAVGPAVEAGLDRYLTDWRGAWESACTATVSRPQASYAATRRLLCLERDLRRVEVLTEMLAEADEIVMARAAESVAELPALDRCPGVDSQAGAGAPLSPVDRAIVLAAEEQGARATELARMGRFSEAVAAGREAVRLAEGGGDDETLASAHLALSLSLQLTSDYEASERALVTALRAAERIEAADLIVRSLAGLVRAAAERAHHSVGETVLTLAEARLQRGDVGDSATARLYFQAGILRMAQDRATDAVEVLERALEFATRVHGPEHGFVASIHNSLGNAHKDAGQLDSALSHLERALAIWTDRFGPQNPNVAHALNNIANVHDVEGDPARARELYRKARDLYDHSFPAGSHERANVHGNLAKVSFELGAYREGLDELEAVLAVRGDTANDASRAWLIVHRANAWIELGHHESARVDLVAALEARSRVFGAGAAATARTRVRLGAALRELGRGAEALALHERAVAELTGPSTTDADRIEARSELAHTLLRTGRPAQALAEAEAAVELARDTLGGEAPLTAWAEVALARAELALDRPERARDRARAAVARIERPLGAHALAVVPALRVLADAEWACGDPAAAAAVLDRAATRIRAVPEADPGLLPRVIGAGPR